MTVIQTVDLFGETIEIQEPEPVEKGKRKPTVPKGYAATPGTGPEGETCKTCLHKYSTGASTAKAYWKCNLMRAVWTGGPGTDIRMRSPACSKWEKP